MTDPLKRPPLSSVLLSEGLDNNLSVGCAKRQKLGQNVIVTNTPHTPTIDVEAVYEELACGICMALSHRPTTILPCLHSFCWGCIQIWFKTADRCPKCNQRTSEARPNRTLDCLAEKVIQVAPDKQLPSAELQDHDTRYRTFKAANGGSAVLRTAYTPEAPRNDDLPAVFWPCPSCALGNATGFTCEDPIPEPEAGRLLPRDRRPARGENWPDMELADDHGIPNSHAHINCSGCTVWMPIVEAAGTICDTCSYRTCSKYDSTGKCPRGINVVRLKDVNEIRPDLPLLLEETARPGLLNRIEWERFREYLIAHDIDLVRILKEVAHLAQEQLEHPTNLVSSASVVGGTNGTQPPEDQGTRAESAEGRSGEQAQVEAAGGEVSSGPRLVLSANQQELFRTLRNTHYGMWHRLAMHHWCKGCMGAAVIKAGIVAWWIVEREKGLVPDRLMNLADCVAGIQCSEQDDDEHAALYNHVCARCTA